jgi:F0F1-type ATP synthase epsilon subunit
MAHHEEMIIAIKPGEMRIRFEENGEWEYAAVGQGFCQIANNRAMLLADLINKTVHLCHNSRQLNCFFRVAHRCIPQ